MPYKLSNSPILFDTQHHAKWAAFFTELCVRWEYKSTFVTLTKSVSDQDTGVWLATFTLPEYSGGLHVQPSDTWTPSRDLLLRAGCPIWVPGALPMAKATLVYALDEFESVVATPVVPGYMHSNDKLFTNPRRLKSGGYIPDDLLQRHGKVLQRALDAAYKADISFVEGYYKPTEPAPVVNKPTGVELSSHTVYQVKGSSIKFAVHPNGSLHISDGTTVITTSLSVVRALLDQTGNVC